jgi:hypothetical protein
MSSQRMYWTGPSRRLLAMASKIRSMTSASSHRWSAADSEVAEGADRR